MDNENIEPALLVSRNFMYCTCQPRISFAVICALLLASAPLAAKDGKVYLTSGRNFTNNRRANANLEMQLHISSLKRFANFCSTVSGCAAA